jgi:hypothetical protein
MVMKSSVFWDITPCSPLKINRLLGGTRSLHLQSWRISQVRNQREAGSKQKSWKKMEAKRSSETSVDFQHTTWHYVPEDRSLHWLIIVQWRCTWVCKELACNRPDVWKSVCLSTDSCSWLTNIRFESCCHSVNFPLDFQFNMYDKETVWHCRLRSAVKVSTYFYDMNLITDAYGFLDRILVSWVRIPLLARIYIRTFLCFSDWLILWSCNDSLSTAEIYSVEWDVKMVMKNEKLESCTCSWPI